MSTKMGVIGDGNVGSALARGLQRAGHEVRAVGKEKGASREVASWGEVVFLAVPFGALEAVVRDAGDALTGIVVADVNLDGATKVASELTSRGGRAFPFKVRMTRSAARARAPHGIRVVAVAPGFTIRVEDGFQSFKN